MRKSIRSLGSVVGLALLFVLLMGTSVAQERAGTPRGYTTTPSELQSISQKAKSGVEPYKSAVSEVIGWANRSMPSVSSSVSCGNADSPVWIDETGVGVLYANALSYHLTGETKYADRVVNQLKRIMTTVLVIPEDKQCRLNFSWGTPELVASADLIETYWGSMTCQGPTSSVYNNNSLGSGNCRRLFQNWLAKNPYYITSLSAVAQSNWGAAAATTTAYIADYLWDRTDIVLKHRHPREMNNGADMSLSPSQAYQYAKKLTMDRLNGFGIEHNGSTSCDLMSGSQQQSGRSPVKSQYSERGIIPDDARREQYCNIGSYNGEYQNYPQLQINNTVQHCELMLRRGDRSCYDNVRTDDIPSYRFTGPDGSSRTTHLYPGRGSIERAINAVIIDSNTEWRHDAALYVAYRYYSANSRLGQTSKWARHLDRSGSCSQGICFGKLTHGFPANQPLSLPQSATAPLESGTSSTMPLPPPPPPSN